MQAELCSNMGSLSRFWCRFDMSGGTKEERETDKGYNALYQVRHHRVAPTILLQSINQKSDRILIDSQARCGSHQRPLTS
jgi:hypothetical protein